MAEITESTDTGKVDDISYTYPMSVTPMPPLYLLAITMYLIQKHSFN